MTEEEQIYTRVGAMTHEDLVWLANKWLDKMGLEFVCESKYNSLLHKGGPAEERFIRVKKEK